MDGVARLEVFKGDFVAEGDVHIGFGLEDFVGDEVATFEFLASFDIDNADAHGVMRGVMNEKLDHAQFSFRFTIDRLLSFVIDKNQDRPIAKEINYL